MWVPGFKLRVGDTIRVWWQPGRDTITALAPYSGPLMGTFPEGAQIASFAVNPTGMTINNVEAFELVT